MKREIRTVPIEEFRVEDPVAEGQPRKFSGYAAVFNSPSENLGGFRERINKGAFTETIKVDDVRALFNHDPNYVLGRNKAGTLKLKEDARGLKFEVEAPNTSWASDLAESVKRGDINQCSFGFYVMADSWVKDGGEDVRVLDKVQLFDVSIVTYPAYTATSADVRSADEVYRQKVESEKAPANIALMRKKLELKEREVF